MRLHRKIACFISLGLETFRAFIKNNPFYSRKEIPDVKTYLEKEKPTDNLHFYFENSSLYKKHIIEYCISEKIINDNFISDTEINIFFAQRGNQIRAVVTRSDHQFKHLLGSINSGKTAGASPENQIESITFSFLPNDGPLSDWVEKPLLVDQIRRDPDAFWKVFAEFSPPESTPEETLSPGEPGIAPEEAGIGRQGILDILGKNPDLVDFLASGQALSQPEMARTPTGIPMPFDEPTMLPGFDRPAAPRRRSVLFSHHCYYNFYYLAAALRRRGWDAICVTTEADDDPNTRFYHGSDVSIYDPDPVAHLRKGRAFFAGNADRFGIIHSYGVGRLSLFQSNYDADTRHASVPWDFLELKRRGTLIGYSHSGCLDGVSRSRFRDWCPSMCPSCPWELRPDICSDAKNVAWGRKLTSIVDLFCTETDPSIDFKGHPNAFRGPLTFAIDPELWRPDIQIPDELIYAKSDARTIRVYHAVGNFKERSRNGRNVKGTQAVISAIDVLQAEGINIELQFIDNVPSRDNRFVQVQADIIVDQLNYGRYGALAREGMMLGKPVVGRVNKVEHDGSPATACIQETPIVHADEHTVLDVLRDLALNPEKRAAIGQASREHAIKWWSADRLAERFEHVYDHIRAHGRPPREEDVP